MRILIVKLPKVKNEVCQRLCEIAEMLEYDIAGIVSVEKEKFFHSYLIGNHQVYPLAQMPNLSWDKAIFHCEGNIFEEISPKLIEMGFITEDNAATSFWLLKQLMIQKYEDIGDPAIQETLEYWKTHEIGIFNQHLEGKRGTLDRVFFDDPCGLPNIYFKTVGGEYRKMFFPRDCNFFVYEGKPFMEGLMADIGTSFVENLMAEQLPTSPHLYTKGEHKVNAGDIVIDAGVCEGNFALRYVDICSKIYLFECDLKWLEALNQTFRDYRDKVEIIPKFLSDVTDGEQITIDDAIPDLRGKNIFLKMDIEGAEPKALHGAKNLLTNNFVKASVCAYHNADDCVKIKSIFQKFGYKTSTSSGWMVYIFDPKILDTADFRKGIVYAENY